MGGSLRGPNELDGKLALSLIHRHEMGDGRVVAIRRLNDKMWEVWIEGDPTKHGIGWPLNSSIADVLGYEVAHEEWPEWIDVWAAKAECE